MVGLLPRAISSRSARHKSCRLVSAEGRVSAPAGSFAFHGDGRTSGSSCSVLAEGSSAEAREGAVAEQGRMSGEVRIDVGLSDMLAEGRAGGWTWHPMAAASTGI